MFIFFILRKTQHLVFIISVLYTNKGPFGIYGRGHRRKIGEGHAFFFFVEGMVIQLFFSLGGGSLNFGIHENS